MYTKKCILLAALLLHFLTVPAQEQANIKLSCEEVESLFLKNNLQLIAEKYNIDIADAAIMQAKLWDNPTLSIGNVNLWSTKAQQGEINDPPHASYLKNTEFSIELSQIIQTANKRGKLIRREKVAKEIARQEFEDVLRGLKTELRKSVYEMQYAQAYIEVLTNQQTSTIPLVESYKRQVQQGNMAKGELLRLQSSLLELENEVNGLRIELAQQEKTLKVLLNMGPQTHIEIINQAHEERNPEQLVLSDLLQKAGEFRPDMKQYRLQTQFQRKSLEYEKSLRTPDLTLSANYDRYGGVWKDFVGFGVSIDLPFLNRNRGNIKAAQLSIDQNLNLEQQQHNIILHEVAAAYTNYTNTYRFYKKIADDSLLPELDTMLNVYAKNLLDKNISMLEYVDFMEAYRSNKQTMLSAQKELSVQFEELQYLVGTDIK